MGKEIEGRWLVKRDEWVRVMNKLTLIATSSLCLAQGYLSTDPDRIVRVRTTTGLYTFGHITIKTRAQGGVRDEFEYEIPSSDAKELLNLCRATVRKWRFPILVGGRQWVVDVFDAPNAPLVLAECEVETREELDALILPSWVGESVLDKPEYGNSQLALHPYSTWGVK